MQNSINIEIGILWLWSFICFSTGALLVFAVMRPDMGRLKVVSPLNRPAKAPPLILNTKRMVSIGYEN